MKSRIVWGVKTPLLFALPPAHMCWKETRRICPIRMRPSGLLANWAGRRPRRCFKAKLLEHSWSVRAASRDAMPVQSCECNSWGKQYLGMDQFWDYYYACCKRVAVIDVFILLVTAWMKKWSTAWSTEHLTDMALLSPTTCTAHWKTLSCTTACTP